MNQSVYHLIVFIAALASVVALVITGHDSNVLMMSLLSGIIGGTGANASGNLFTLPSSVLPSNAVTSPPGTIAPTIAPQGTPL